MKKRAIGSLVLVSAMAMGSTGAFAAYHIILSGKERAPLHEKIAQIRQILRFPLVSLPPAVQEPPPPRGSLRHADRCGSNQRIRRQCFPLSRQSL